MRTVCLVVLGLAAASCGAFRQARLNDAILVRVAGVSYDHSMESLQETAEDVLKAHGYSVRRDMENHVLETEWSDDFKGSSLGSVWTRYIAFVKPVTTGRSVVRFFRMQKSAQGTDSVNESRAFTMWGTPSTQIDGNPFVESQSADVSQNGTVMKVNAPSFSTTLKPVMKGASVQRDLALEQELLQRLSPAMASLVFRDAELAVDQQ